VSESLKRGKEEEREDDEERGRNDYVNACDDRYYTVLATHTFSFPISSHYHITVLENAVKRAQHELLSRQQQQDNDNMASSSSSSSWTVKGTVASNGQVTTRIHARLMNLPPYCFKPSLADISAQDVGTLMQLVATVVKTGPVQMLETARTLQCCGAKGCQRTFVVHADLQQRNNPLELPKRCVLLAANHHNPKEEDGSDGSGQCAGTNLQVVAGGSVHTDYQEIKIQQAAGRLKDGQMPRSLLVKLQHDLVDASKCQPGDEVVVVGNLLAQWSQQQATPIPGMQCHVTTALAAHSIRVVSDKGSSVWQSSSSSSVAAASSGNNNNNNSLGELDTFRKEFEAYWERPEATSHPIQARDFICRAVSPQLYGLQVIKLALLVTLIGGVSSDVYDDENDHMHGGGGNAQVALTEEQQHDRPDAFQLHGEYQSGQTNGHQSSTYFGESDIPTGANNNNNHRRMENEQVKSRRRDQSHLLLVGDPGTGKSQILRFAAALCPRSVMTTGVGTTSAGLTCAAVREGNGKEFALEAGALVLADKGVCCIDEFGCIQERDRTTIHEAMEQQTLSVAKAGIVCKLNCRATIIAVMNPRDCIYDNNASLAMNTGLGTPLLSRFDLIFKLIDTSDPERDSKVTTYLLNRAIEGVGLRIERTDAEKADKEDVWSMEKLRAYISVVRERFQPNMSDQAAQLLERHYESCRAAVNNTIPVTVRFLESLIRLSQAHARLMFRNVVMLEDAVAIIELMESTASAHGGFDGLGGDQNNILYRDPMATDFSTEPDLDLLCFEYRLLERYRMLDCLDPDRRSKAQEALRQTLVGSANNGWDNPSNTAGGSYSTANCTFPVTDTWNALPSNQTMFVSGDPTMGGGAGWPSATQDHYGRVHYTQPTQHNNNNNNNNSNNNNNKRPRC
jgi:DNA replicative helicase MCM subunit Mcm2 (Cdc46/Mcm family)